MPERIQLKRTKGWRMPTNTVKVDRSGMWGNPFVITTGYCATLSMSNVIKSRKVYAVTDMDEPDGFSRPFDTKQEAQAHSASRYREWIQQRAQRKYLNMAKAALWRRNLACWCAVGSPCHADVLLELVNEQVDKCPA